MSDIASKYFDIITNKIPKGSTLDFTNKPDESSAKLLFVLSGFFGEYFAHFFNEAAEYEQVKQFHMKYIEHGLKNQEAENWASKGIEILEKIAENGWIARFLKDKEA